MNEFLMHREIVCKILGIVLVLGSAAGCGYAYCKKIQMQLAQIRQLQQLMLLLQGEIQYQCTTLPEAFINCGNQIKSVCGQWLAETGGRLNNMEGIGFQEIWQQQLEGLRKHTVLSASHIEDLQRLGNHLSFADKETQMGALKLYCHRLKEQEENLTRELPVKMKLGTTLGLLSGLFLIILLM